MDEDGLSGLITWTSKSGQTYFIKYWQETEGGILYESNFLDEDGNATTEEWKDFFRQWSIIRGADRFVRGKQKARETRARALGDVKAILNAGGGLLSGVLDGSAEPVGVPPVP